MENPVIEVRDFRKTYGDFIAVDGISFEVNQGEIFGLLGHGIQGEWITGIGNEQWPSFRCTADFALDGLEFVLAPTGQPDSHVCGGILGQVLGDESPGEPGRPEYDVASLIYDPYVSLTETDEAVASVADVAIEDADGCPRYTARSQSGL